MKRVYIGIDVQASRGCPYMVLDGNGVAIDSGWLGDNTTQDESNQLRALVNRLRNESDLVVVGIDAPRQALSRPRHWYWNRDKWESRNRQSGYGRHCEVVVSAYRLANPQWTPIAHEAKDWMKLGFELYDALEGVCTSFEVFPSASYTLLSGNKHPAVTINFSAFRHGPKDMLDACLAALTVREFLAGRGCEVGGGDGLGTIVLPTKLPAGGPSGVLGWPE